MRKKIAVDFHCLADTYSQVVKFFVGNIDDIEKSMPGSIQSLIAKEISGIDRLIHSPDCDVYEAVMGTAFQMKKHSPKLFKKLCATISFDATAKQDALKYLFPLSEYHEIYVIDAYDMMSETWFNLNLFKYVELADNDFIEDVCPFMDMIVVNSCKMQRITSKYMANFSDDIEVYNIGFTKRVKGVQKQKFTMKDVYEIAMAGSSRVMPVSSTAMNESRLAMEESRLEVATA